MKMAPVRALAVLAAAVISALPARGDSAQVTPVQKVVQLLENMLAQGKKEKHDEQVQFAAYKQFCDDTSVEKQRSIKEANAKIEVLKADIEKYLADAKQLSTEIAAHEADIAAWDGDMKAARKVRELEKADYDALHKDYSESVDALERAIQVLKKQAYDRKHASFAQVAKLKTLNLIPAKAKRALDAFLQEDPDEGLAVSAPEAAGYEFQSHGIIEMLEKLLDKFVGERTGIEKEEMNAHHQFEMLVQDLTAQTEQATTDKGEKTESKAKKLQAKAEAEGELTDTTATRDEDKKYLDDLTATCDQKARDFESRQQLRAEEIVAVQKAIEIISSDAVAGNADKHLPAMAQTRGRALAQAHAAHARSLSESVVRDRAVSFLRRRAGELDSRVLQTLAARVSDDPFAKVKKLIKDLIVRLMEEANAEAEHKGWCDTELSTNEQTRKEKTAAVETLHAEIDELQASIAKLSEELTELAAAVAELDKAMAEATELRAEEKKTNEATIADSQEAQTAVAQALVVLKEFYAKAAEATALLQQQPPPIFEKAYTGMGGEAGGVVGMLEVIESDFARLEAETKASEASAQKEYDMFMTDSKVDKEAKTTDIEHKTAKRQDEEQALTVSQADLEGTQKELNAALAYFDKLKPSCVDAGVSYDDRVARRKEEIESLQEALKILNGEDLA